MRQEENQGGARGNAGYGNHKGGEYGSCSGAKKRDLFYNTHLFSFYGLAISVKFLQLLNHLGIYSHFPWTSQVEWSTSECWAYS